MPNWCFTSITIGHKDKDRLIDFYNKVEGWLKKSYKPNDFDSYSEGWLGNIVGNANLSYWDKAKGDFATDLRCRGYVTNLELSGNAIHINTETAWGPMMRMWDLLCKKYLEDAEIWFTADEPGNCVYVSNDPDTIGKYNIEMYDEPPEGYEEIENDWEVSEKGAVEILQKAFKTEESDISKLIEMAEESGWIAVNQYSQLELSECD